MYGVWHYVRVVRKEDSSLRNVMKISGVEEASNGEILVKVTRRDRYVPPFDSMGEQNFV